MMGFIKSKRGAIGIGTLIIFIALVLVAAVAAAVIINTAGHLQQKASLVGRESTKQVASGIQVIKVAGYANSTNSTNSTQFQYNRIVGLAIFIGPNIGDQVDLTSTIVVLSNKEKKASLVYSGVIEYIDGSGTDNIFKGLIDTNNTKNLTIDNTTITYNAGWILDNVSMFGIIVLQDEDKSTYGPHPTINYGDKVVLTVNVGQILGGISPRERISGEVIPEYGASGIIEFITPSTYNRKVIYLQ
ncbi:MAG TPA: flagellin [Methanothermococcus okinawensis]|nr:flagellin [Methanothermococcus okinawensis]